MTAVATIWTSSPGNKMPIYEFICDGCGRKSTFFIRSINSPLEPVCNSCGSSDLKRALSGFSHHRTTRDVHEAYGPPSKYPDMSYYNDPRNIGRNVEETFQRFDYDMPAEVRDAIDSARDGTIPEGLDL